MKKNLSQKLFLIMMVFAISANSMLEPQKKETKYNPNLKIKMLEIFPHPSQLIDPKTGKPYRFPSDAWDAFWDMFYTYCQRVENLKIEHHATRQKLEQEIQAEQQKMFIVFKK